MKYDEPIIEARVLSEGHLEAVVPLESFAARVHDDVAREHRADVIVPVFNALDDTRRCLESLLSARDSAWSRVIVVNDGSDAQTTELLRRVARDHRSVHLVEHPENRGYTRAVNTGMRASTAPYVVLLNSDTVVPSGWLDRMIRCAASSPRVGIVGPLSNAATWQSLPRLRGPDGRFAVNALPAGLTVDDMARVVADRSTREYPRTPFVNGFCFLIARAVVDAIGVMDEEAFPVGYGEENDYCIRAVDAGFEVVVADDAYVYHAKSKSFGHERREELSRSGMQALRRKHGDRKVDESIERVKGVSELNVLRARIDLALGELRRGAERPDPVGLRVLFLLPVKGGSGGAHSVVQEAVGMRRLGVHVRIAVREQDRARLCKTYQDVGGADQLFVGVDQAGLLDVARGYDVAIATIFKSVEDLARLAEAYPELLPAYYVQDYEPMFFDAGSADWQRARLSYERVPSAVLFAKTRWIAEQVARFHGVSVRKVQPSIDHDVYFPMPRADEGHLRIAAMIRPQTPRRGAARTMRVLREVVRRHPDAVSIHVFGCDSSDPRFQELPLDFPFVNYGELVRPEVASLLRRSDIFVDLSDYQAFGRTGLEAMASGCAVVVPSHGGTDEYARDGENAVVVDSMDEAACVERICELVASPVTVRRLRGESMATAAAYSIQRAAVSELLVLAEALAAHRAGAGAVSRGTLALVPARHGDGGVTARGRARVLWPWRAASLRSRWTIEVVGAEKLPDPERAGVAIVQRGSVGHRAPAFAEWLAAWRRRGGRLVFDADDDVFDPERPPGEAIADEQCGHDEWLASISDAVLVSTEAQRALLQRVNPHVFLAPPKLEPDLWGLDETGRRREPRARRAPDDPIMRVGYIGDPSRPDDLDACAEALARLEREHPGRVEIEVIGAFQAGPVRFGKRVGLPKQRDYPRYVGWLQQRATWDVALLPAPLHDPGRSPRRFLEYSALGLVTVCADTHVARPLVRDGESGLVVSDRADAWYGALKRLLDDRALRESIASAALADLQRFGVSTAGARDGDLGEVLARIMAQPHRLDTPLSLGSRLPARAYAARVGDGFFGRRGGAPSAPRAERPAPATSSFAPGPLDGPRSAPRRKLEKLVRDPERFFADSKSPVLRALVRVASWRR